MRGVRCRDAVDFLDRAGDLLGRDEVRNNLPFGLARTLLTNPERYSHLYEGAPYFGVVEDGARVVSAAVRTPPAGVVIAGTDEPAAVAALARLLYADYRTLPGVHGTGADAGAFAGAWKHLSGQAATVKMRQRIYECSSVVAPAVVAGSLRPAVESDRELLVDWYAGFMSEALGEDKPEEARRIVEARLLQASDESGLRIWEDADGAPATMVGFGRATPHSVGIAPVWTPRDRRRQGFGTAATAATTSELLEAGRSFVYLITDLGNPTSNRIYQAIGYRPVCDAEQWEFAEPAINPS
jgi:predicted GNAT family acetyltransferase